MKKKTFVLDTNVLLHDPESILKFPKSYVVIPVTVLEELNRMKRLPDELGKHSRTVFRLFDSISKEGRGDLHKGLNLDNGASLRIQLHSKAGMLGDLTPSIRDNRILMSALLLQEQGEVVVFVSKDFAARIKAEAIGLEAEDYENLKFSYDDLYRGIRLIDVTKREVDEFFKDSILKVEANGWKPNEYCVMKSPENSSAIGKYDAADGSVKPLIKFSDLWGVRPRNVEQKCAVDLLLRDDIKLVTLIGPAGTGKTLLALACGMRKVFDDNEFMRILVSRPVVPLGRDIGYLPGTKEEKLFHWMQPIYDNLEYLCDSTSGNGPNDTLQWVMDSKKIEMEAVTYIRGRSLPKAYIIVDEAQNLTPHEMKTIISRAGEGTKVVLTGDPTQIDNPYLDQDSNGLTYTVGRFSDEKLYGHVYLSKTERSELAALAAEIL
ncbi:PhoH family protein [Waddlia chondrophila]|uniref:PhoH-like protein n=1 Tax=Waddlia chondrophila (strain ATCC VR-1470 / WSU 86-1044) TaxID=716544 RepID=D6YUR3_WADCW|nr:PhoH family protein [Waddlia chondrophila]ADI37874.1 PhoH-like protein [Waddlia chondrophila WSU 86-1044]